MHTMFSLFARADADAEVKEGLEGNNNRRRTITIGPDLVVSALSAPNNAAQGATITITDTTRNRGAGTAGLSVTRFYLSLTETFDSGAVLLGTRSVPSLGGGAQNQGTTQVTIPLQTPVGKRYIFAVADGPRHVAETNEGNNRHKREIIIQ